MESKNEKPKKYKNEFRVRPLGKGRAAVSQTNTTFLVINPVWFAWLFQCAGRRSGQTRTPTALSLTWWGRSEWGCTPCCGGPAPTAPWSRAPTAPSWSRDLPVQVSHPITMHTYTCIHMSLTELSESERRSCWHRSPGLCLHVLLPGVHGVHVGKKC